MKNISIVVPYKKIENKYFLWVQKRESEDNLSGLLEFPGGKIEVGEDALDAGVREVYEEVGVELKKDELKQLASYELPPGLNIFVVLYEDKGRFSESGYMNGSELVLKKDMILPNNVFLITEIMRYLEEFKL